ncbi:MAG: hypothetical protein A2452_05230 [Candidatus Firestonebacteria bacterium RIFOXYC2_FULL_39_67]|nr:MAG: hypothetical protein A2536_11040 [Candidatus Firestonebacteria bacterium RIFOXYD2_FULL_39_29]OGF52342.1 MAG: hypothetical protein A2497_03470 [Candidatus Firestonebacteria bacterium RifOxyC12_full_39_7]OGF54430.1 MAG: hypothetical protein A2452_05230 [Candidatus Firestonebacteria bacterium RIFOXYC2_FULL_39_67]
MKIIRTSNSLEISTDSSTSEVVLGLILIAFGIVAFAVIPDVLATEWSYKLGNVSYKMRMVVAVFNSMLGIFTIIGGLYNIFKKSYYIFDSKSSKLFYGEGALSKKGLIWMDLSRIGAIEILEREYKSKRYRYWVSLNTRDHEKILIGIYFEDKNAVEKAVSEIKNISGL